MKKRWLVYAEREKIEEMYISGAPIDKIAESMERNISTIYNELHRGGTGVLDRNGRPGYSARIAQEYTQKARRGGLTVINGSGKEDEKECQQNR